MTNAELRILVLFGGIPLWGQERENIEVIDALVKETGAECLFVTHREWGRLHVQPELDRRGLPWTTAPYAGRFEKGMPLPRWIANLSTILHASVVLGRILRRFRPTHIHVCNPVYFVNFLPVLLMARVPMIYRLGDEPSLHHWAYAFLWRRIIAPRVTKFVCISRFIQHSLREKVDNSIEAPIIYGRPSSRVSNVTSTFPIASCDILKFVYVGQIRAHKGAHLVVEVAIELARNYDIAVYIAGDYKWENPYAHELINRVRKRKLDNRIMFLGEIDDVDRLLALSNVHLCPSLCQEALGLVVLEAKCSGRPSVVFPSGALPEIVTHGVDGYVCEAATVDALKAACLYYIENPERARRHGIEAKRSLERLGVDSFAQRWRAVYDSVV